MEHTAKIVQNAQLLGDPVALTEAETAQLRSLRGMYQALRQKRDQ